MDFDWKSLVKGVAPVIGGLIGGPAGGVAISALANGILGDDAKDMTVEQKQEALEAVLDKGASPEMLAKIKQIDAQFKKDMKSLDIDVLRINAGDRSDARSRELALKDITPRVLAYMVTTGFFAVLATLMFVNIPSGAENVLMVILGSLCTAWVGIINYYYGSSKGSDDRNIVDVFKGKK